MQAARRPPRKRAARGPVLLVKTIGQAEAAVDIVAKTSPGEFVRQVRQEAGKITWPTRKETVQGAIMVLIMVLILSVFFLGVDQVLGRIVQILLTFAA